MIEFFKYLNYILISFLELFETNRTPKKTPKVALVKQFVYADLYSKSFQGHKNWMELIFASNHRSGPMGLFSKLDSDFFIVDVFKDKNCNIYKEKGINKNWQLVASDQKKHIKDPKKVDWNKYDLVICIENAIPVEITKQYPNVVWATMVEHHRMKAYNKYNRKPPNGYNLFFNQRFGPTPFNFFKRKHVVDWPYSLNFPIDINSYFNVSRKDNQVVVDTHCQDREINKILEEQNLKICLTDNNRTIKEHLELLSKSKFLILPINKSKRMLWGNITLEAAALDCIIIGNKIHLWNPHLVLNKCHVTNLNELRNLLIFLSNSNNYEKMIKKQRRQLKHYGFNRPLNQLNKFIKKSFE